MKIHRIINYGLIGLTILFISCNNNTLVDKKTNDKIFLTDWREKDFVEPKSVSKELRKFENAQFLITIDYDKKLNKVSKYMSGINATTYTGDYLNDKKLIDYVSLMKPGMIRFPGGDASNMYFFNSLPDDLPEKALTFDGEWTDFITGSEDVNWRMNTEKYYAFLDSVNSEGIITVNYPYARYGTSKDPVAKAASLAADWVRYDNGRTKFWEIGNETYACWEGGFRIDTTQNQDGQPEYINGELYGQHFKVFADSMRAAAKEIGAKIFIGAVFADADDIWDGSGKNITKNWNNLLAPQLRKSNGSNYADFISVHSYFLNKGEQNPFEIINTSIKVPEELQDYIHDKLNQANVAHVPLALTEWNIKEPHQTTQAGGLHAVSTICKLNEMGFGASSYFALKDYWRGEKGDFGTFSNNDPELPNSEPYPTFYHFYFLNKILGDHMVEIKITPANDSLLCYASSYSKGGMGIIIINKSLVPQSFKIDISNYNSNKTFYWYELSKSDDENVWSEKLSINGLSNTDLIKGGPIDFFNIPAWKFKIKRILKQKLKDYLQYIY
jgi:hypothetical protein